MKNKNKLKYLTLGILLTGAVGFSTLAVKQVKVKAENENVVNINRENKKLVSYDDVNETINFNAIELNDYYFTNLADYLLENHANISSSEMYYPFNTDSEKVFAYEEYVSNDSLTYLYPDDTDRISLNLDSSSPDYYGHFYYYSNGSAENSAFNGVIGWDCSFDYANIKSAIELDIQANESSYGESIITAISSGLGLIPDLAQEFLTGFTTLFWNSAQEKLTDFGTFALVFLGVAITMAVVKLCLAILRSNTGA